MPRYAIEGKHGNALRVALISAAVALGVLALAARSLASFAIEIAWWKELGQLETWFALLTYGVAPVAAATLAGFAILWVAHARALKFAGTGLSEHKLYARISTLLLLGLSYLIAAAAIDNWTVIRYAGGQGLVSTTAWHDAIFAKPLSFYLFDLPFYDMLRGYVLALAIFAILIYWLGARGWQLRRSFPLNRENQQIDPNVWKLEGGLESGFLRGAAVVLLLSMAV